jgi:glycosyltransferase involved in cell wall biosynthesis
MAKLAKYLPEHGWDVTVVCSEEPLAEAVDETLLTDLPASVRIVRIGSPARRLTAGATATAKGGLRRESLAFRLLYAIRSVVRSVGAIPDRWIGWALRAGRLDREALGRPEVLLTSGPPHSVHLAGWMVARRLGIPQVMDLRDEWTIRPSSRSRLRWRRSLERWLEQRCFAGAAFVTVVSDQSRDRYSRRYPQFAAKIRVIPNGFDPADFDFIPPAIVRPPGDRIVIGYGGTFQVGLDVEPFLGALGDAVHADSRIRVVLQGPFTPQQTAAARRHIAPTALTVAPFVPHREALARMADWDALCVIANDGSASLAGKLYECLALRKPILAVTPEGPATALIRSGRTGECAPPDDRAMIGAAIQTLLSNLDDGGYPGIDPDDLLAFDRSRQAGLWAQWLDETVRGGTGR